jgi:hypothetical protein
MILFLKKNQIDILTVTAIGGHPIAAVDVDVCPLRSSLKLQQ